MRARGLRHCAHFHYRDLELLSLGAPYSDLDCACDFSAKKTLDWPFSAGLRVELRPLPDLNVMVFSVRVGLDY